MRTTYKNVVVEVSLDPQQLARIRDLANSPILVYAENVYLINIFNQYQLPYLPVNIDKKDFDQVEKFVTKTLDELRKDLKPADALSENWHIHSIFSGDSKIKSREYLRDIQADLVITSTRGEQNQSGLFCDSFSYYLVSHAPCDVYVLTPEGHTPLSAV